MACSSCCVSGHDLENVAFESSFEDEILRLIAGKDRRPNKRYGLSGNIGGRIYLALHGKGTPCIFLENGLCSIWNRRPKDCQEYPQRFLERKEGIPGFWADRCPGLKGANDGN